MNITTNPSHLSSYKKYVHLLNITRTFLSERGYLELDLPALAPALIPESYLEVFKTEFCYMGRRQNMYLTPSPELFMKRILAHVKTNCYSLAHSYRNSEPDSSRHSPEFMMLEYYRLGATYMDLADELLELLQTMAGGTTFTYRGSTISLDSWQKLTVDEAFVKYAGCAEGDIYDPKRLMHHADSRGYTTHGFSYEDIFSQIYAQDVEPHLGTGGRPTIIYDYPREFAALAKLNPDGQSAQRYEFYIVGIELGDCYTELTDPTEQQIRFDAESQARDTAGRISHPVDEGFIKALEEGLGPCAGIAIGFERLAAIMCDVESIHDLRLVDVV